MLVDEIMTRRPVYIRGGARAHEALTLATERDVHYLLVVDADEDLRGLTCLCDVSQAGVNDTVSSFAHSSVTYVMAGESAERAAQMMDECAVGCLPVLTEPGKVIGILTRHDLRRAGFEKIARCAACGSTHGLSSPREGVVFCRSCVEETPKPGTLARRWYCTLGDGD